MVKLRDYQIVVINEIRKAIAEGHKRIIVCLPTGAGKTSISSHIIKESVNRDNRCLFVAHRKELVIQSYNRLKQFGVFSGIIMQKFKYNGNLVNVASIQTLIRRKFPPANIIFPDECHHASSNSYQHMFKNYPDAIIIGLTATPKRLDGKPLGDIFEKIISPITMQELIDKGYLVQPRYFASKQHVNLDGVHTKQGDYDNKELFNRFDKPKLYKGVTENYKQFADGKKAIVFNLNVEHSKKTRDEFVHAGYTSEHLDAETPELERAAILERFKTGEIQILNNVMILTEGYDLPDIECVIINRATKSENLYLQMVGRGLRTAENKTECIVIDHGDNVKRLGFAEDEREYTLDGKKKKKGLEVQNIKECPKCLALIPSAKRVCECGYQFPVEEREVEIHEAKFEEVKRTPMPAHLRKPWSECTDAELKEIAQIRGYKPGWIWFQRQNRDKNLNQNNEISQAINSIAW